MHQRTTYVQHMFLPYTSFAPLPMYCSKWVLLLNTNCPICFTWKKFTKQKIIHIFDKMEAMIFLERKIHGLREKIHWTCKIIRISCQTTCTFQILKLHRLNSPNSCWFLPSVWGWMQLFSSEIGVILLFLIENK